MKSKSTISELVMAWLLTIAIIATAIIYAYGGGRGWILGTVVSITLLIALVAGIAER